MLIISIVIIIIIIIIIIIRSGSSSSSSRIAGLARHVRRRSGERASPRQRTSGKSSERHAEGTRPPRRQTYISVMVELLGGFRFNVFPYKLSLRSELRSPKYL